MRLLGREPMKRQLTDSVTYRVSSEVRPQTIWRGLSNVRSTTRSVGIHERTEEILSSTNHSGIGTVRRSDRIESRLCSRAFYLYSVLASELVQKKRAWLIGTISVRLPPVGE